MEERHMFTNRKNLLSLGLNILRLERCLWSRSCKCGFFFMSDKFIIESSLAEPSKTNHSLLGTCLLEFPSISGSAWYLQELELAVLCTVNQSSVAPVHTLHSCLQ